MQKDKNTETQLSEEGFLSRWSRRKIEISGERDINEIDMPGESQQQDQEISVSDSKPESWGEQKDLTDDDMPEIDGLTSDSDVSMFMSPGVSDELRRLALRKLFSRACFNIRDGLDDYDDDFTSFAALGNLITCDMKHQMEVAEERKKKEEQIKAELAEDGKDTTDEVEPEEDEDFHKQDADAQREEVNETLPDSESGNTTEEDAMDDPVSEPDLAVQKKITIDS
jgi:hypothetical protein